MTGAVPEFVTDSVPGFVTVLSRGFVTEAVIGSMTGAGGQDIFDKEIASEMQCQQECTVCGTTDVSNL